MRYLGVVKESSYGAGGAPSLFFDISSEDISPDQQTIYPDTVSSRTPKSAKPGGFKVGGSVDFYVEPENIGILLEATLGKYTSTGTDVTGGGGSTLSAAANAGDTTISLVDVTSYAVNDYVQVSTPTEGDAEIKEVSSVDTTNNVLTLTTGLRFDHASGDTCNEVSAPFTHTFNMAKDLPSLCFSIGVSGDERRIPGIGVTSFGLESPAGDLVSLSLDVIGQKEELQGSQSTPTFSSQPYLAFHEGQVQIGGTVNSWIEAVRLNLKNDIPDDAFVVGSRYLPKLHEQSFEVSGEMDITFESWDEYKRFLSGTTTGTTPGSAVGQVELILTLTIDANNKVVFTVPDATYNTSKANISSSDRVVQNVAWQGVNKTEPVTVVLTNSVANWD